MVHGPNRVSFHSSIERLLGGQHSEFFRISVFDGTWKILSRLIRSGRNPAPVLKVAVVGCSAGEESYSLAVALHEAHLNQRTELRAIDNDPAIIIKAQRGVYQYADYGGRDHFFRSLPPAYKRYFVDLPEGTALTLSPEAKKQPRFQLADAAQADFTVKVPKQDVLILNNVLVHTSDAERPAIVANLAAALSPLGIVIVNEEIEHPALFFAGREGQIRCYQLKS